MKPDEMCPYYDKDYVRVVHRGAFDQPILAETSREAEKMSRKKVKCPECGRKLYPRIGFCEDGCCVLTRIPPHKKKGWWKKKRR